MEALRVAEGALELLHGAEEEVLHGALRAADAVRDLADLQPFDPREPDHLAVVGAERLEGFLEALETLLAPERPPGRDAGRRVSRALELEHGAPALLPSENMGMRIALETWFDEQGVRPRVVGEFEDATLMMVAASLGGLGFTMTPTVVGHAALKHYGLKVAGSITVSPETVPGADRISEIHKKVGDLGATCVFAEPQFEPKLVKVVTEGTSAKAGTLDPEGATLAEGPELYFDLMRAMTGSLRDCLGGQQ